MLGRQPPECLALKASGTYFQAERQRGERHKETERSERQERQRERETERQAEAETREADER